MHIQRVMYQALLLGGGGGGGASGPPFLLHCFGTIRSSDSYRFIVNHFTCMNVVSNYCSCMTECRKGGRFGAPLLELPDTCPCGLMIQVSDICLQFVKSDRFSIIIMAWQWNFNSYDYL